MLLGRENSLIYFPNQFPPPCRLRTQIWENYATASSVTHLKYPVYVLGACRLDRCC